MGSAAEPTSARNSRAADSEFVKAAALEIDRYVAGWYRQQKMEVPEVTGDATFLRRVFLVAIGRIPTAEEARFFLEIEDSEKRRKLIDYLLKSAGYASHMSNWAFDLLRVVDSKAGAGGLFLPYRQWVFRAIESNQPWDEFTSQLLSAQGNGWDSESAAVGYYVRDRGMALDNIANTMRVFLGSRMECAQCHDDPFGETERHDFYELAAFTNGQDQGKSGLLSEISQEYSEEKLRRSLGYDLVRMLRNNVYGLALTGGGSGQIHLPGDYQYRDGKAGELIGARTPFGKTTRISERRKADDGRKKLAEWITGRTGEQFPSVIANRMWARVMGRGVYEPVDSFVPAEETHLPAMMSYLTSLMEDLDYDLRGFQKILLNTRTFQFVPNPEPSKVLTGDDFHGRQLTRLSAEQIWDSLITLASGDPDKKPRNKVDTRIRLRGRVILEGKKDMIQLSDEVLAIKTQKEMRRYFDGLLAEIKKESKGGREKGADSMMSMSSGGRRYGKGAQVRASELPSPAPRNHLLFLFGQSDRDVVEGANREPNVGQVLTLMNGFVQKQLVNNPSAHIYKSLEGASSDAQKVRRLYVAILSRPPSEEEMGWMLEEIEASGDDGFRNIVSALVMSSEFLFVQ